MYIMGEFSASDDAVTVYYKISKDEDFLKYLATYVSDKSDPSKKITTPLLTNEKRVEYNIPDNITIEFTLVGPIDNIEYIKRETQTFNIYDSSNKREGDAKTINVTFQVYQETSPLEAYNNPRPLIINHTIVNRPELQGSDTYKSGPMMYESQNKDGTRLSNQSPQHRTWKNWAKGMIGRNPIKSGGRSTRTRSKKTRRHSRKVRKVRKTRKARQTR